MRMRSCSGWGVGARVSVCLLVGLSAGVGQVQAQNKTDGTAAAAQAPSGSATAWVNGAGAAAQAANGSATAQVNGAGAAAQAAHGSAAAQANGAGAAAQAAHGSGISASAADQTVNGSGASANAAGQTASAVRPFFASLTDPACPVTTAAPPMPMTDEMRVLYFPTATQATIHDPKRLTLHIAFDDGNNSDSIRTIVFERLDDGVWQAKVALRAMLNSYAIYWVEEPETKRIDTNNGEYFEVPFCDVHGERMEKTIEYQARTYNGWLESRGFKRPADFTKALQILDDNIRPPRKGESLISSWWLYKYELGGETAATRAALVTEIQQFVHDHQADGFGFVDTLFFVERVDWIPIEIGEQIADVIEKKNTWYAEFDPHVELLEERASHEKDPEKRLRDLRELIARYPDSKATDDARMNLFLESKDIDEKEKLYAWLSNTVRRRYERNLRLEMARAYLEAGTRYHIALTLLDDADALCDERLKDPSGNAYSQKYARDTKGSALVLRAEILLRMGKAKEAVAVLGPHESEFKRGHSFYVLGTALEKTGKRREALDAYIEGAVRAGESQRAASEAMGRLWIKLKMGSRAEMLSKTESLSERVFHSEEYKPKLVSRPAPELNVTTMGGERFNLASMHGKPIVLNFWATWCGPCVYELKGLEQFQAKHPEVVVLTMVTNDTEQKDLQEVLKEQRVTALRISEVPSEIFDRYGAIGVPHTFVIDESGVVRVHHFEGLDDATRILEADLAAIGAEEAKQRGDEVTK
jgi:thiol-disulfide isomerase/thioredoxin